MKTLTVEERLQLSRIPEQTIPTMLLAKCFARCSKHSIDSTVDHEYNGKVPLIQKALGKYSVKHVIIYS